MKFFKSLFFFLLLVFTVSQAASEPEQTVEGAQKFLSLKLPGNRYEWGGFNSFAREKMNSVMEGVKQQYPESRVDVRYIINGNAIIKEAVATSKCSSKLVLDISQLSAIIVIKENPYSPKEERIEMTAAKLLGTGDFYEFESENWGKLKSVEQEKDKVIVRYSSPIPSTIIVGSEGLASRIAYALDFLRINCDEASGTGF